MYVECPTSSDVNHKMVQTRFSVLKVGISELSCEFLSMVRL